jgi:hypothetical protein
MVRVCSATVADAPAMGRVHVRAWQAAYRGHMPDDYLGGLPQVTVPEVRYRRRSTSEAISSATPVGTE